MSIENGLSVKAKEFIDRAKAKLHEQKMLAEQCTRKVQRQPAHIKDKYEHLITAFPKLSQKAQNIIDTLSDETTSEWTHKKKELRRTNNQIKKNLRKLKWRITI